MKEIEQWEMFMLTEGKSENTVNSYIYNVQLLFNWLRQKRNLEEMNLDTLKQITLPDLHNFMSYLMNEKKHKETSRAKTVSSIKEFYKYLIKINLLTKHENITEELNTPKLPKREKSYLNEIELQQFIDNIEGCHEVRDKAIAMIFCTAGVRLEELENMNIGDIKQTTIDDKEYYYANVIGKGNKERTVSISKNAWLQYNKWLEIRPDVEPDEKGNPLFVSERNNRLTRTPIYWMIKRALRKIDRGDCSPHSLRHSFATLYLNKGGNIKALQEALGHENIETTSGYLHATKQQVIKMSDLSTLNT